ncbi:MAG TPA: addiction module protein [Opitutaceae bacterium]|nr:addiction module protein [Opitutaceae bacterium]
MVEKHPFRMATTVEKVTADALQLPSDGRAFLVETLLESLSGETDAAIEKAHLAEIRLRRNAVRVDQAKLIDGEEALRQTRFALRK